MERRRRFHFKVPSQVRSHERREKSYVEFKNLTDDVAYLYWVDFNSRGRLYAELKPIQRSGSGLQIQTFVSHPWLAVCGKKQLLLNGKKYFLPPIPFWDENSNDWLNKKWRVSQLDRENIETKQLQIGESVQPRVIPQNEQSIQENSTSQNDGTVQQNATSENEERNVITPPSTSSSSSQQQSNPIHYFEVLILRTGCMSLKTTCALQVLQYLQGGDFSHLNIPKGLKKFLEETKEKYFIYTD